MLILGLLLIIVALVVFGYLFFGTSDLEPLQIDLGVFTVELTPLHLFLLGAATLVVLVLGLLLLTLGLRASRRRQREVKELRKAVEQRPAGGAAASARDRAPVDRDRAPVDREVPRAPEASTPDRGSGTGHTEGQPVEGPTPGAADHSSINLPTDHREDPPSGPRRG